MIQTEACVTLPILVMSYGGGRSSSLNHSFLQVFLKILKQINQPLLIMYRNTCLLCFCQLRTCILTNNQVTESFTYTRGNRTAKQNKLLFRYGSGHSG